MKLSIITVNYNDAKGLEKTIKSVVEQTYRDFEFIVIDGGSIDNSVDIIKRYSAHIDYWVSERDGGIYQGMNKGLFVAKGEYVNFMNGGDCYHAPDVLERVFSMKSDADIITGAHAGSPHRNVGKDGVTMLDLYKWAVDHQASFIKREVALRHPYDENYRIVSDWKFFIEALVMDNCSFCYTDTIVVDVDMGGISNNNDKLDRKERDAVLHELLPNRILDDYRLMASIHPEMLKLAPRINRSQNIQNFIMRLARMLLSLKGV